MPRKKTYSRKKRRDEAMSKSYIRVTLMISFAISFFIFLIIFAFCPQCENIYQRLIRAIYFSAAIFVVVFVITRIKIYAFKIMLKSGKPKK